MQPDWIRWEVNHLATHVVLRLTRSLTPRRVTFTNQFIYFFAWLNKSTDGVY